MTAPSLAWPDGTPMSHDHPPEAARAMLARRDEQQKTLPADARAADLAPLMGDLAPTYWAWCVDRYLAAQTITEEAVS